MPRRYRSWVADVHCVDIRVLVISEELVYHRPSHPLSWKLAKEVTRRAVLAVRPTLR